MADLFGLLGGGQDPGLGDLGGISHRDATTLSLLQALQGMSEAGTRRTATPIGSIAQTLAPLLVAPIQARQMEQRSALESLLLRAKLANALGSTADPEMRAADLAYKKAQTDKLKSETGDPYAQLGKEDALYAHALQGDPMAQKIVTYKTNLEKEKWASMSNEIAKRQEASLTAHDLEKTNARLNAPATSLPENKGKVIINTEDGTFPKSGSISQRMLEDPNSPYKAIDTKDKQALNAAKQVQQQLDRMKELIPKVLPKNRLALPITISEQAVAGGEKGQDVSEFDRLAAFEKLTGIREFIASGRMNVPEIQAVGSVNRMTDNQDRALGKVKAMEDLLRLKLSIIGVNPEALSKEKPSPTSQTDRPITLSPGARPAPMATPARVNEVNDIIKWGVENKIPKDQMRAYLKTVYGDTAVDLQ